MSLNLTTDPRVNRLFLQAQLESFERDRGYMQADIDEAIAKRDHYDRRIAEIRAELERTTEHPECSICRERHGSEVIHSAE